MRRLKVALVFGDKPKFNTYAFKYFILAINKLQNTYELMFPDFNHFIFDGEVITFSEANSKFEQATSLMEDYDYKICIVTAKFDNNFFFNAGDDSAVITTDVWDKYFSPPSLFEYLLHSIYCCLIFSQKVLPDTILSEEARSLYISSHRDTKGCIADFTRNKYDDRVDILSGYICDQHKKEIRLFYGDQYLEETMFIIERKWIGSIDEKDTIAYNLKHVFKFDINKDSGFNKTKIEKFCEKFYEMPYELASEILKLIITVLLTYLLLKLGLPAKA